MTLITFYILCALIGVVFGIFGGTYRARDPLWLWPVVSAVVCVVLYFIIRPM